MLASEWLTLLIGTPIIIYLLVLIARRVRALRQRIVDVRLEMERNPQPPYAMLAELFEQSNQHSGEKKRG